MVFLSDNRKATPEELKAYDRAWERIEDEIGWVATKSPANPDRSPAEVVKLDSKWKKLSAYIMGAFGLWQRNLMDFSCQDYWESPGS